MSGIRNNPLGTHANAWNAAATASGTSTSLDTGGYPFVSAFGTSNGAVTLTLQYSMDDTNYYDGPSQVLSGSGNFRIDATCAARFVRLKSSAAVTVTATIAAKGG